MGSIQWEIQPASQREDLLAMATKLEQIAANLLRPKRRLLTGSCKRSRCCESTAEERSAVTPHATFCGSRGRVTASDDPVENEEFLAFCHCLSMTGLPGDVFRHKSRLVILRLETSKIDGFSDKNAARLRTRFDGRSKSRSATRCSVSIRRSTQAAGFSAISSPILSDRLCGF